METEVAEEGKSDFGECLGGAMYIEDFRRLLRELGCQDYRTMSKRQITLDSAIPAQVFARVSCVSLGFLVEKGTQLVQTDASNASPCQDDAGSAGKRHPPKSFLLLDYCWSMAS